MAYTTVDKVLHRAKLVPSDIHANEETAQTIVGECITDAEAEINALTRRPDGWDSGEDYYATIQAAATDLAASYLFQQDIAARAVGRGSEEVLIDRATQLHNRALALLAQIPGGKKLFFKATEEDEE